MKPTFARRTTTRTRTQQVAHPQPQATPSTVTTPAPVEATPTPDPRIVELEREVKHLRQLLDTTARDELQRQGEAFAQVANGFAERAARGEETTCPCCGGSASLTRANLKPSLLVWLRALVEAHDAQGGTGHVEASAVPVESRDYGRLAFFDVEGEGLIVRVEGGRGWWRPGKGARAFLAGRATAPATVYTLNGKVMRVEGSTTYMEVV